MARKRRENAYDDAPHQTRITVPHHREDPGIPFQGGGGASGYAIESIRGLGVADTRRP